MTHKRDIKCMVLSLKQARNHKGLGTLEKMRKMWWGRRRFGSRRKTITLCQRDITVDFYLQLKLCGLEKKKEKDRNIIILNWLN